MSTKSFDAVVIGAGPGGYPCAIRLAQLGKKVAIVERDKMGGVCLNVGCIPSKALIYASNQFYRTREWEEIGLQAENVSVDLEKMQAWKDTVVKKLTGGVTNLLKMNGVEAIKGSATFVDANTIEVKDAGGQTQKVTAKHFVLATGSRIIEIPSLKFNGKNIINSTEALELKKLPKKMVVIGGGFIGVEIGFVYAKLGTEVTIVESLDNILTAVDRELVQVVEKKMRKIGMKVLVKTKALGVKGNGLEVEVDGKKQTLDADVILVCVGRRPNSDNMGLEKIGVKLDPRGNVLIDRQSKTNVPGVFAIGDVAGSPQLAHRATMDGLLVAETISGKPAYRDYRCIPWAVFCDPEIAVCGLTEDEAKKQNIALKVGKFPFAASGRALSTNESEGMIKVLINAKDESVVGVHMVGPEASNLIAEAALAIELGATAEDIVRTIHTHPTLPEAFMEGVETALGHPVHIFKPAGAHARK